MPDACFNSVTLSGLGHALNCIKHNDRTNPPNYLLPESTRGQNYGRGIVIPPRELIDIVESNTKQFERKIHPNTKLFRESIILIDKGTTEEQIENCYKLLKEELGMTMLWEYEHNDEGHVDMDGVTRKNHHIHFGYTFYDFKNHKSHSNNADVMRKAQDICSETLDLKRGISKTISGRSGLSHQQFRRMKKEEEKLIKQSRDESSKKTQLNDQTAKGLQTKIDEQNLIIQAQNNERKRIKYENQELKKHFAKLRTKLADSKLATKEDYQVLNKIKAYSNESLEQRMSEMDLVVDSILKRAEKNNTTKLDQEIIEKAKLLDELEEVASSPDPVSSLAGKFVKTNQISKTDTNSYFLNENGTAKAKSYYSKFEKFIFALKNEFENFVQKVGWEYHLEFKNQEKKRKTSNTNITKKRGR